MGCWLHHCFGKKKFIADLEGAGFIFNPYDPCVANREVQKGQQTIRFHVDDLMSSHRDAKVNDRFEKWLNDMCGKHGEVKCTRGKVHDYLGMTIDFRTKGKVIIQMTDYVKTMLDEFSVKLKEKDIATTPASGSLFNKGQGKFLESERSEEFHTMVAKGLFLTKRARPHIHTAVAVMCTRVQQPQESKWGKLLRMMKYLNGTKDTCLKLSVESLSIIKWFVDVAFAVHPDFKSHTGAVMSFGGGAVQSLSKNQKLNTRSSTEAELVGVDDAATMICWTKLFMEAQGYTIDRNILYQDNKSAILLKKNGKTSAAKRSSGERQRSHRVLPY